MCVCLSVCLQAYLQNYTAKFTIFLCMLSMSMAQSSFGGIAIRYVLSVLWLTYLRIMARNRQCERCILKSDLTLQQIPELTHQTRAGVWHLRLPCWLKKGWGHATGYGYCFAFFYWFNTDGWVVGTGTDIHLAYKPVPLIPEVLFWKRWRRLLNRSNNSSMFTFVCNKLYLTLTLV